MQVSVTEQRIKIKDYQFFQRISNNYIREVVRGRQKELKPYVEY